MARRDNERAARLLVEAHLYGDVKVVRESGIARQTLHNYRRALKHDPELRRIFDKHLRSVLRGSWVDDLDYALRRTIQKLVEHIDGQVPETPESIEAIAKAFSALAEIQIAKEVLSVGVADRQQGSAATAPGRGPEAPGPHLN